MRPLMLGAIFIVITCISYTFYCITPFSTKDDIQINYPESFIITTNNSFETQLVNECSAFSSAYVLRHFGENETGLHLYEQFNYKLPFSGYVLPKGILDYFEDSLYKINMYTGTLETLKTNLTEGTPIIVLVGKGLDWQHYMTVVGYNDNLDELYFFDSLRKSDENGNSPGNRTLSGDYFLSMWDNDLPIFNHLYFTLEEKV